MSKLTMYEIEAELIEDEDMDAMLWLTRYDNGYGENVGITMSLSQLAIISDRFLPKGMQICEPLQPDAYSFVMEEHARLLRELGDRIDDLRSERIGYLEKIVDECPSGIEISMQLRMISDLAYSLERHLLVLMPNGTRHDDKSPMTEIPMTENTLTVTQEHPNHAAEKSGTGKRGRPKTDNALTGAERQRRYLERKAQEQTGQLELEAANAAGSQS